MLLEKVEGLSVRCCHLLDIPSISYREAAYSPATHRAPVFVLLDKDIQPLQPGVGHAAHTNHDAILLVRADAVHEWLVGREQFHDTRQNTLSR